MNSEITDNDVRPKAGRWLLYDANCRFCTKLTRRLAPALHAHGILCAPLQDAWVAPALKVPEDELLREMRFLERDRTFVSGAAAVVRLSTLLWWARPIVWLAKLPGGFAVLEHMYRWVANHRTCAKPTCNTPSKATAPLSVLPVLLLLLLIPAIPNRWLFMWIIAGAIWSWLKLFTLREVVAVPNRRLRLAYLFAWPGTDALSFFTGSTNKPGFNEWFWGAWNFFLGAALLALAPRFAHPLASGWTTMAGLVFILHFGGFQLLSCFWRANGVDARPLMDTPLLTRSLGEFWGRRWNTGFSIPARRHLFEPLKRHLGPIAALAIVFLVSGIVHELAISVPAQGGYGLPTLYFAFQGAAILFERSKAGKWLGLGHGIRGRVFAIVCAGAPAFWLFHPPFVERVILPFLDALHSTKGPLL